MIDLTDFFIRRMTVLGRGLVFQPVLVTQTCTYNSKKIMLTLQIFHQKRKKISKRTKQLPPPPQKKITHNKNKRGHNTSECFDMSLKLGKLQVKKWQRSQSNDK